jgi:AraC-like DNA-binding protein
VPLANINEWNDPVGQDYYKKRDNDISRLTRHAIVEHLPSGLPSLDKISSRLNISTRHLQRKLSEAGVISSSICEQVLREMAELWLTGSDKD